MKLDIVTPEEKVYSDEVEQVSLPTPNGEITVLPNHLPVITQVVPGELKIKKNGKISELVTGSGFVEISGKKITLMTDLASTIERVNEKEADEARKRAEEALKQRHTLSEEEFAVTAAALEKALAQLKFKRKYKSKLN